LFMVLLERQLLLKGVITKAEWKEMKSKIYYDFLEDNHFTELKNAEIFRERLSMLGEVDQFVGKYYSADWVRRNILMQTEDEIEEMDEQMALEAQEMDDMEDDIDQEVPKE
jgi:hypothetical protein